MIFVIAIHSKGELKQTFRFLDRAKKRKFFKQLDDICQKGVEALSAATPKDSGKTSECWSYRIEDDGTNVSIFWVNSNFNKYVNIAIILQYGHGTGTGGYVTGVDYINPALKPIFQELTDKVWKEVTSL